MIQEKKVKKKSKKKRIGLFVFRKDFREKLKKCI